jgi:hypothetical protein
VRKRQFAQKPSGLKGQRESKSIDAPGSYEHGSVWELREAEGMASAERSDSRDDAAIRSFLGGSNGDGKLKG